MLLNVKKQPNVFDEDWLKEKSVSVESISILAITGWDQRYFAITPKQTDNNNLLENSLGIAKIYAIYTYSVSSTLEMNIVTSAGNIQVVMNAFYVNFAQPNAQAVYESLFRDYSVLHNTELSTECLEATVTVAAKLMIG